ncbi:MAG: V-type ATPase subunit [Enterocloster asparagiformis]|nr:V-type ATPase subunit [Enterocloster asparagiformis]
MGSLITYSGIATKVKAMERWRISDSQFEEMGALESVPEAVDYLRRFPPYGSIFDGLEDHQLHRGNIEQQLNLSQYQDFAKLYKFANLKQRRFLDLYFMHYEIGIIKTCLRNAVGHRDQRQDLSMFREFFERHSSLDLIQLSESQNMEQFVANLNGSAYYGPLSQLVQRGSLSLPECENTLDMIYFRNIWRIKKKYLKKSEQEIIGKCFGTRMDMLNLQWIYRSKKFYHLTPGDIYAILIPINLHLTKAQIGRMVEAGSAEEFLTILEGTWYRRSVPADFKAEPDLKALADEINDQIYLLTSRREPYSIAILNSYLYFKEREIERIITTLESIRYGVKIS